MDGTKFNRRFLKMLLKMQCEKETLDCVIHEMRAVLGEKMPEEDAVRAYQMCIRDRLKNELFYGSF